MSFGIKRLFYRLRVDLVYAYDSPRENVAKDESDWSIAEFAALDQIPTWMRGKLFPLSIAYPLLIKKRLDSLEKSLPIVSFCGEHNLQSEKGLLKNGFVLKQRVRVRSFFSCIHRTKEVWRCVETDTLDEQ